VQFDDVQLLQKDGFSTFNAPAGVQPNPAQTPHVIQGAIEQSNVKSVVEMTRMIEVTRHYTQMSSMLQQQHDMRRSSLDKLADVPA
jgi:flagellar basal body rod protein FlgG